MNKKVWRYRIITNLQCNNRCSFCYQTFKPEIGTDIILDKDLLSKTLNKVGHLKRATLMGGESTLLENLHEYIEIVNNYVDTVCLVTNGKLLTETKLKSYEKAGLKEIGISINSINNYDEMKDILLMANEIIDNCRVNLPRCIETSNDNLYKLVRTILKDDIGCVVCEDLMGRYGEPHDVVISSWGDVEEVKTDGCNFITYRFKDLDKEFGLFAHYHGYNKTDVIVTPVGVFSDWKMYCEKIGNHGLS